ncbi:DUF2752 domain-containing protein [Flavobacterium daemonense]|uniref:DUF2752 domain-containing protein n=1 Tax=Flavobacterium daemonense TaxID=1393049 RepID=UPI001185C580|nr:DUF2752 domain-containing protein [Flavobacterium daemonense]KAF2327326.1 DUF2752 domain-containing protein [Flavobacterium daemonense]
MILFRNKEYHFFNFLIFSVVLILILYLKTEIISIKCPYAEIGLKCRTCGLTTSFKRILNGDFSNLNLGYLLLFIAFLSQLILRPLVSFALFLPDNWKLVRNIDVAFSIFLFGYTYIRLLL